MFDPAGPSLRELGRPFWDEVVRRSRAQVLSVISNDACDAYLLSESSLFVLDDLFELRGAPRAPPPREAVIEA